MSKTKSDISKSIMEVKDALTAEKNNKLGRLRRITDNPEILSKIDSIALSQEDLYDILEKAAQDGREKLTVYLLGRRFAVPYNVGQVKYIGLELGEFTRPVLALSAAEKSISLKEKGIAVENCALLAATRNKLSASESEDFEKELQSRSGAEKDRLEKDIEKEKEERYRKMMRSAQTGSAVHFGDYDWLVLKKSADTALLITKDLVGQRAFHPNLSTNSWADCSLRQYLNGEFLQAHFSAKDRTRIEETQLSDAGCKDKIFLLSVDEVNSLFSSDQARIANYQDSACRWWLRSPGYGGSTAALVLSGGGVNADGFLVCGDSGSVRPALYLKF